MKQVDFDTSPVKHRIPKHIILVLATLLISSCANELFRNPVPVELEEVVEASTLLSLYKMFLHAEVNGYDFRYVSLPKTYEPYDDTPYDPEEMRRMFRIGHKMGLKGDSWLSTPLEF
jgi:hypothetical protein